MNSHLSVLRENVKYHRFQYVALGTDMWALPGIAVHLELEYMVKAGMTPSQAIIAATRNAAGFFNSPTLEEKDMGNPDPINPLLGTIRVGRQADLLILDANPLDDIRNTRTLRTIIKHGVLFDHNELVNESKR